MRFCFPWSRALAGALGVLALANGSALAGALYSVTDLTGGGYGTLYSASLNNQGQVAGRLGYYQSRQDRPTGDQPYLYSGGKVTLPGIQSPQGGSSGTVLYTGGFSGLNDQGQAVGRSEAPPAIYGHPASVAPGGILYDAKTGQTTPLPLSPAGINNSGQILGSVEGPKLGQYDTTQAALFQGGSVQTLANPPGTVGASPVAINDAGQIVVDTVVSRPTPPGPYGTVYPDQAHAFRLDQGTWTDLGTLGGSFSSARAMNANGDVVGVSSVSTDPNGFMHAFLAHAGGKITDLGTLPGDANSLALGINNKGQVVGLSFPAINNSGNYHGFLWQNGVMTALNDLMPAGTGWNISWGLSINDQGQILAYASNGSQKLVLLSPDGSGPAFAEFPAAPVPEPGAIVVFALVCAVPLIRRRVQV
ncbi:MAG: hypothetical protein U0835_14335 [Isosphaeraceae bacterium]